MAKITFSVLAASLVLSLGAGAARAQDKATKDNFERKAHALNVASKKVDGANAALRAISVETGVPLEKVQSLYKNHESVGPAGVLIACVMADETKLAPQRFLEGQDDVKSWEAMIKNHNVPLEKVTERLEHVQRAVDNPNKASKPNKPTKENRR